MPGSTGWRAAWPRLRRPAAVYSQDGADTSGRLPASLGEALDALDADERLAAAFGAPVVAWLTQVKRAELARHDQADDKDAWQAREYFSRF